MLRYSSPNKSIILRLALSVAVVAVGVRSAADESADGLAPLVLELINDQDKDMRALGFEQVRTDAPGEDATRQFATALPKLSPEAQVGLISALADRKDPVARPAVVGLLEKSPDEAVRVAAIRALGPLGEAEDVPRLVKLLSSERAEKAAARLSLVKISGEKIPATIAAEMKKSPPAVEVALIGILAERRAHETIPELLTAAVADDASVRRAAMTALGELAGPEQVAGMVQGVLKAKPDGERDAAERAVAEVCHRITDASQQAQPLLDAMSKLSPAQQTELLPALGRIGGPAALEEIEAAIADADPQRHEMGLRGLFNWPNASVAPRMIELAKSDPHPEHRNLALKSLIRVAPLPDARPDEDRLELLKQVMSMCTRDEERLQVLKRASAIRTIDTLRFVLPYVDQPAYAEQACETVVELAHHRPLREPNKAEFDRALDKVLSISKDPIVRERAARYKKGQTWARRVAK
jgi:HEAT repeat protein